MDRIALFAVALAASAGAAPGATDETSRRVAAATTAVQDARGDIPRQAWERARCVVVFPGVRRATFVAGTENGKGVMSCRAGDSWTAPLFTDLANGAALPAGAERIDVVMLVTNESGAETLLRTRAAIGPGDAESYGRVNGRFAALDLAGAVLAPDDSANRATYGPNATPRRILATREISAPPVASPFIRALGGGQAPASASSASSDRSSQPAAGAPGRSAADEDVRARLLDVQAAIDRLLAEAPATVGTSGTIGADQARAGMVTIDRTRLMQLRQQIDAALAALNRPRP